MDRKVRVMLVDDHPLILFGLKSVLAMQPDIDVVATSSDGDSALKLALDIRPDVLVLDVIMPGLNGMEVARHVKAEIPDTAVLMLSSDTSLSVFESLLEIGIDGFVSKMSGNDLLLEAIRSVADGYEYYGTDIARLIDRVKCAKNIQNSVFTPRELDVVKLSCEGLQYKEIATRLGIKDQTVSTIKKNIFHKLGINNSVELVLYAIRNNLISL